ncbi:hypothetical protein OIV83_002637 [Microbotryomycetes sp. JL201]|nr:hypothetical protein OIV83_002637 [Microbotryomycetes sp. JL201]
MHIAVHRSFATALVLLEQASADAPVSQQVVTFIKEHLEQLKKPYAPFSRAQSQQGTAGQLVVPAKQASTTLSTEVAERFKLDDKQALVVINSLPRVQSSAKNGPPTKLSPADWDKLTAFVFEERMAVIAIVAWILRTQEDPDTSNPAQQLAAELAADIVTPTFGDALLESFRSRTREKLPEHVRNSSSLSLFWTKQLLAEQKALLELVFLTFYAPVPANGRQTILLFRTIRETEWARRQETFGYFDDECQAIVDDMQSLLTIIGIESLNLEAVMEQNSVIPAPGDKPLPTDNQLAPSNVSEINLEVERLTQQDEIKSSLILLGWAFVLSRVTDALMEQGVPDAYHDFASRALRVEVPAPFNRSKISSSSSQPLFQLYASHALSSSTRLFDTMISVLKSPLLGSQHVAKSASLEPNIVGYLSVFRGLLTSVPLLVRLSFLSQEQYAGVVGAFAALYGNPAAIDLCAQFWQDFFNDDLDQSTLDSVPKSTHSAGEAMLIELALSRFPVQLGHLLKIIRALSAGIAGSQRLSSSRDDDPGGENAVIARRCALCTFTFLSTLTTLTQVVPSAPSVTPLPYEVATFPEVVYRATRPIPATRLVSVPPGTTGSLISQEGSKPVVVSWNMQWSALKLFVEVLQDFAGVIAAREQGGDDVFNAQASRPRPFEWSSQIEHIEDVISILDILRLTLQSDPSLGRPLVEHLQEDDSNIDVLEIVFRMLENSLNQPANMMNGQLVSSQLGLVAALLPSYPGGCWTFLRGSTLLFPSTLAAPWTRDSSWRAVSESERVAGTYPIVLSLLDLLRALVLEYQATWTISPPEIVNVKRDVLARALSWLRDEVWVNFSSWRFIHIVERCAMAQRIIELFQLVIDDAQISKESGESFASVLVDALLTRASMAQVAPLLTTINAGAEPVTLLRKAGKFVEAQAIEDVTSVSLRLMTDLLKMQNRTAPTASSLLEKLCLSHIVSDGQKQSVKFGLVERRPEIVEAIASYILAPVDVRTAVLAAKTLMMLTLRTTAWHPRPPSLISLLGGSDKAEKFIVAALQTASDPAADEGLQVAIWNLAAAIADTQPGLALLLVTGRQYPFVDEPTVKELPKDGGIQQLSSSSSNIAPPPFRQLPRTALGVGLEVVGTWTEAWDDSPELLMAVLRFFDYAFQHLVDYGNALDSFRARTNAWECFVKIAFKSIDEEEPEDEQETRAYCHRLMSKAHAVRIIALDIQDVLSKPTPLTATSVQVLFKTFNNLTETSNALHTAVTSSCSPSLHQGVRELVHELLPTLDLDKLRSPPSTHVIDDSRDFGPGYIYSLVTLRRRLDGYLVDAESTLTEVDFDSIVEQVVKLNLNLSLIEAELSHLRSWGQLLDIVAPLVQIAADSPDQTSKIVPNRLVEAGLDTTAKAVAAEDRGVQIVTMVQGERLSILLVLVKILQRVTEPKAKDHVIALFGQLALIYTNPALQPLESVTQRALPPLHRNLLRITYFAFGKLNSTTTAEADAFSPEQRSQLSQAVEGIMRLVMQATRDLLLLARVEKSLDVEQDISLAVSVITQIVSSAFVPPASLWLAHCQTIDFFRSAFEVFVQMAADANGRPLYAQHVLDLCLALSSVNARAAEMMALEGLMTAMTNNALTAVAEAGAINVLSADGTRRSSEHELWTGMLTLVVSVMSAIGDSTHFVEHEIVGFVRLYGAQISVAMNWSSDTSLTLPALEELSATLALMRGLLGRAGIKTRTVATASSTAMVQVASLFAEQSLYMLQQITFVMLHPNRLMGLIQPTNAEERAWIEKDTLAMDSGEDLNKRPVVASVTLALLGLARVVVDGLTSFTLAIDTLVKEPNEWKPERAIVLPTATVTSREKASIGTLFDLASFCQDTLRAAHSTSSSTTMTAKLSTTQSPTLSSITPLLPYSPETMMRCASQTLESLLMLASTQLGLWLCREAPTSSASESIGSPNMSSSDQRRATTLMKREITGELAGDLISLLEKSSGGKPLSASTTNGTSLKSSLSTSTANSLGKKQDVVSSELCTILKSFVQHRVLVLED